MYSVSDAFLTAAKQPIQTHRVVGTIGSVSFDDSNIVQGTFNITNQCSDTSDVTLGSVYTGTLTATFHGINIARYAWINKVITPYFGMQLANLTWEEIPIGVYKIKEARHTAEGVEVVAYDNMIKLDKKFKKSKFKDTGKMFEHISTICTACGLNLANTEAEIQSMPNGNTECGIVGTKSNASLKKRSNDIETYRDLVYWIAQTMACFATIDRNGMLKFVRYQDENSTVDTITEAHQLVGASFNDYVTRYTGIYVTNSVDDEELYYGYDLDALNAELTAATNTLSTITSDLADLEEEHEQGQITEEEYLTQKKALNKQKRNIEKRIAWLNKAIANVEDGEEDGAYLELGCNPILQPDGVGASYITMRTNVLEALDTISYTPFTCDTVCGVHYDLGDVLQFTGGHAGSGECCCLMCYDWTLHGAYSMQGFGQDPALQAVKSKTAKSASKANKNSNEANRTYTGSSTPAEGNDGDIYVATSGENIDGISTTDSHSVFLNLSFTRNENGSYNIITGGVGRSTFEYVDYEISGLVTGDSYTFSCTGQWASSGTLRFYSGYHAGFCFNTTPHATYPTDNSHGAWDPTQRYQSFYRDGLLHSYTGTFTATDETMYLTTLYAGVYDGTYTTQYINNFTLVPTNGNTVNSVKVKQGDAWVNIDYAKEVSQVSTSGEKIAEVSNSDGTTTDIYAPYMSGATSTVAGASGLVPAPASGDEEKYLRGDGTWATVSGGGGGGGVSTYAELPDKPSINSVTLSTNKTSSDLGIVITLTQAEYDALTQAQKLDENKVYYITNSTGEIEKLHFDWSHSTLPTVGEENIVYAIYTGDISMPYSFYAWDNATQSYIQLQFEFNMADYARIDNLVNLIYPVGSIYISVNDVDPSLVFGGTWQQIKDRFLLACGDTYNNGATGGSATHTLTVNEMPSHNHALPSFTSAKAGTEPNIGSGSIYSIEEYTVTGNVTNAGGGAAHNNMPPYLSVYMWKRTA